MIVIRVQLQTCRRCVMRRRIRVFPKKDAPVTTPIRVRRRTRLLGDSHSSSTEESEKTVVQQLLRMAGIYQ